MSGSKSAAETFGSGPDTLSLLVSQDVYQGDALYTISIDGQQVGGTLTASAIHGSGQDDTIDVLGSFGAGPHIVTVNFLNDAYGGSPTTDRNLYVDGIVYDGQPQANDAAELAVGGPVDFGFAASPPPSQVIGTGTDALVLDISQDAYLGDAQYTVSVDGQQIGGVLTASAEHAAGQDDTVTVLGDWGTGSHIVTVDFLNDAYGGSPQTDRNLYVDGISYDGAPQSGDAAELARTGPQAFMFGSAAPVSTTLGSGPDWLTFSISQDAYLGDAVYAIAVDGQNYGTLTASALHVDGLDDTVTIFGNFGSVPHTAAVTFLNDAYGGSATTDRNLYVDGITYDGVPQVSNTASLDWSGTTNFALAAPTPTDTTIGSGGSSVVVYISEDAYLGNAQYTISVDGQQIGGTLTASSLHTLGASDTVLVEGNWGAGTHTISVDFLNDAYGGSPQLDRNLYVTGIGDGSGAVQTESTELFNAGAASFSFVQNAGMIAYDWVGGSSDNSIYDPANWNPSGTIDSLNQFYVPSGTVNVDGGNANGATLDLTQYEPAGPGNGPPAGSTATINLNSASIVVSSVVPESYNPVGPTINAAGTSALTATFEGEHGLGGVNPTIDVAAGATLTASIATISSSATVNGGAGATLDNVQSSILDGVVTITPDLVGIGTFAVETYGNLILQNAVAAGQTVDISGGWNSLTIGDPGAFAGTVDLTSTANPNSGSVLLENLAADSYRYDPGVMTFYDNGQVVDQLNISVLPGTDGTPAQSVYASNSSNGVLLTLGTLMASGQTIQI